MFVEESQLSGIQRRTTMREHIQLELANFLSLGFSRSKWKSRTYIVDDLWESHDCRAIWRFNDRCGLVTLIRWFGMGSPSCECEPV